MLMIFSKYFVIIGTNETRNTPASTVNIEIKQIKSVNLPKEILFKYK